MSISPLQTCGNYFSPSTWLYVGLLIYSSLVIFSLVTFIFSPSASFRNASSFYEFGQDSSMAPPGSRKCRAIFNSSSGWHRWKNGSLASNISYLVLKLAYSCQSILTATSLSTWFFLQLFFALSTTSSAQSAITTFLASVHLQTVMPTMPVPVGNSSTVWPLNLWVFITVYLASAMLESHSFRP